MKSFHDIFVDNMKNLRKFHGFSQEKLGLICNLDTSYIGRIERKEVCPTIKTCQKIALALNQDLSLMFIKIDLFDVNDYVILLKKDNEFCIKSICLATKNYHTIKNQFNRCQIAK